MTSVDNTLHSDARLAALRLYGVLDTGNEPGFDDIAKLAAAICRTPVALVSLVEADRQWFKASVGFEACETPISHSVCQHALRQTDLLVIPDLTLDLRTAQNPLVTKDPFIRFYAGAPLVTPSGHVIGTLCVIDEVPRPEGLSEQQAEMLMALGRQTMMQLELRKLLAEKEEVVQAHLDAGDEARAFSARFLSAEEAGGIGTFEMDIATGQMNVSPEFCRIFGMPLDGQFHSSDIEKLIIPEDAEVRSSTASRRDASADLDVEYRIRRLRDGSTRWISRRARFEKDAAGQPVTMFGAVNDVTDRRRAQAQQVALLALGDKLRDLTTEDEAISLASEVLGSTLGVTRAGYGVIDQAAHQLRVRGDWASPGGQTITGDHDLGALPLTYGRLSEGETLIVANIPSANWLKDERALYAQSGITSMIDIPIHDHGTLVGVAFAHHETGRTWTKDEVDFAHGVADRIHAALAKLESETRQELLNRELGHRLKNQLALVQAIINQTLRSASDLTTARDALNARIGVMASAHEIIIAGEAGRSSMDDIVRNVTSLHDDRNDARFVVAGPPLAVAPRPALSLSLIFHELSTNAAKYGALSVPDGFVKIEWGIERNPEGAMFVLTWTERSGPTVIQPERAGTGSRLIRAGLSGTTHSSVDIDYAPDGVRCKITCDLNSFQNEH